ncbi:MAG: FixH family protein [Limisphaerales bacterium]
MASDASIPQQTETSFRTRTLLKVLYILPIAFVLLLVGDLAYNRLAHKPPPIRHISTKPFASIAIDSLTVNLFTQGDTLRASGNDIFIEFRDAAGKLVDVGGVSFILTLNMPDMVMHSMGRVMPTATPGQYRTTLEPQMAGTWTAKISFTNPKGKGEATLPVTVK